MISICDYRRLLGKDLSGLGLKELQHLEQQLNEGLLSVKERKVLHILSYPVPIHLLFLFVFVFPRVH